MPQFNLFKSEQPIGKTPAVPTAAEQCGCTTLRELVRRVANGSYSVTRGARNSLLRS